MGVIVLHTTESCEVWSLRWTLHCADHSHLQPEIVKCEGRMKISFYPRRLSTLYSSLVCVDLECNIASLLHTLWPPRQVSPAPVLSSAVSALYSLLSIPSSRQNIDKANYMLQLPGAGRGGAGWLRTRAGCKDDNWLTFWLHLVSRAQLSPSLVLFKSETLNCGWIATWILWPGWVPVWCQAQPAALPSACFHAATDLGDTGADLWKLFRGRDISTPGHNTSIHHSMYHTK